MSASSRSTLITGATSSVAQALANLLIEEPSARVLLTSRSTVDIGELASKPGIRYLSGIDLTEDSHLRALAEAADSFFPSRFNIVNAAGRWFTQKPFADISFNESKALMDSNYQTAYGVASHLVPLVIARGGGHFVTFGCDSVNHNYPWMAPYTASKAALQSLTISLANEFAENGLIANVIVLCTLLTERDRSLKPFGDHHHWLRPKEVAAEVANLISDEVGLLNGNAIKLFRYSDSFFHQSYFQRIRAK